jgi:hypothetical protein
MPRRQPPKGYYRASEVEKILNVSSAMVRIYVQKGAIRYFVPEGMKQGYYLKSDVDELATKLHAFINMDDEDKETKLTVATKEDLTEIIRIGRVLFVAPIRGNEVITSPQWRIAVHEKNPESHYVLKRGEEILGYASVIPLKPNSNKIERLLSVELISEANLTPDDIETYEPEKHVVLYIGAIGIKPDIDKQKRRSYGASLISKFITKLIGLGYRGVIIDKIIAIGGTHNGIRLLQAFGFTEIPTLRTGQREFILEPEKSGSPVVQQYKEALRQWQQKYQTATKV